MARAGRKRKINVVRDSSGKSRGEVFDPNFFAAQPHRVGQRDPESALAGYPLGRMFLNKVITECQLTGGNEFAAVAIAYGRVMGIPVGSPRSGSMSECVSTGFYAWEGERSEPDPDEAAKRIATIRGRYNDIHDKLGQLGREHGRGHGILRVMREICIQEQDERQVWRDYALMGDLRLGLNAAHRVLVERRS